MRPTWDEWLAATAPARARISQAQAERMAALLELARTDPAVGEVLFWAWHLGYLTGQDDHRSTEHTANPFR